MTILQLKAASDVAIRNKTLPKSITTANHADANDRIGEELRLRGIPQLASTADLINESYQNTQLVLIHKVGIFKNIVSLLAPNNVTTFASADAGFLWEMAIPYSDLDITDDLLRGGDVTWTGIGLEFQVAPVRWVMGGVEFNLTDATEKTLDPADAEDRIDVFYVDNTGNVGVLKGVAEPNPVKPQVDPATQIELTYVTIPAGSLTPQLTTLIVYDENTPPEWTPSQVGFGSVDFDDTTTPQLNSKDANVTNATSDDILLFVNPGGPIEVPSYMTLSLFMRLKAAMSSTANIYVSLFNGVSQVSAEVLLPLNKNNITTYQGFSIPISRFNLTNDFADTVRIRYSNTVSGTYAGFYLDNVFFQTGLTPPLATYQYSGSNGIVLEGSDFKLGGNLTRTTKITTNAHTLSLEGSKTGAVFNVTNFTNTAIVGQSNSNDAIQGFSTNGSGVNATNRSATVDSVETALKVSRLITTTPSAGIGAAIEFMISPSSPLTPLRSNRIISRWDDEDIATRASGLIFTGVLNAVESDLLMIKGSGQTRLHSYGDGTWVTGVDGAGAITRGLYVDANGYLIEGAVGISGITADNGLNNNTATNVRLGGQLLQNTTIDGSTFNLDVSGSSAGTQMTVSNTVNHAFSATSTAATSTAISGVSAATALQGSTSGNSFPALLLIRNSSDASSVRPIASYQRLTTGAAANGIGQSVQFINETSDGVGYLANEIISKLTDVTTATRTSQYIITGVSNATTADLFTLSGSGALQLNKYGVNSFTGTYAKYLAVTSSGNVIEVDAGAGGEVISADNGITENTPGNVQWGGGFDSKHYHYIIYIYLYVYGG